MVDQKPLKDRLFTVIILEDEMVTLIVHRDGNVLRPWAGDFRTAAYFAQREGGIPVPYDFLLECIKTNAFDLHQASKANPINTRNLNHRSPTLGTLTDNPPKRKII